MPDESSGLKPFTFTPEISFGNVMILVGVLGTIGAGVWQGGMIRATLEAGIAAERELRIAEADALGARINTMQGDIREIRGLVMRQQNGEFRGAH
jgi:hypothetical protein